MISLDGSLRTCKTNSGDASRFDSDRYFNPNLVVCPIWNGVNNKGQRVCSDSWNTRTAGCKSALDTMSTETYLRPSYFNYVTLDACGLKGGGVNGCATATADSFINNRNKITGQFGNSFRSNIQTTCGSKLASPTMFENQRKMNVQKAKVFSRSVKSNLSGCAGVGGVNGINKSSCGAY